MPNVTAICYLSSLLFYGMGYLTKMLVIKNVVTEHVNTYDYTIYVSLATGYFVLAILLAVIGSLLFYVKENIEQVIIEINDIKFRVKGQESIDRRRASIPEVKVKAQLTQSEYGLNLDRRMSS